MNQNYCLVYCTVPKDNNYGELISKQLIICKLAACVNVIENMVANYIWNNELIVNHENLLIIKTKLDLFAAVEAKIIQFHPYDCPEIIAVPILQGFGKYLNWIDSCITS